MYQYRYYNSDKTVVAVSTYAGKTIRGVAKCDPSDEFTLETGKKLASARCNVKIAAKRVKNAENKRNEAFAALEAAQKRVNEMNSYYNDAIACQEAAVNELEEVLNTVVAP